VNGRLRATLDVRGEPLAAFEAVVDDLTASLDGRGLRFVPGSGGGISERDVEVARTLAWIPGVRIVFEWVQPAANAVAPRVHIGFRGNDAGTAVTLEVHDWDALIDTEEGAAGWFATRIAAPAIRAMMPGAIGDWITDRRARRPAGPEARTTYADPLYHYPNFRVILEEIAAGPDDFVLEVGCGGGAMLSRMLAGGCRAAAIDHSRTMLHTAADLNRRSIDDGRLRLACAAAGAIPFRDGLFTRAAMTGVLGFLPDPVAAFAEIRRTLKPGGRLVALGSDPALRGTPAAPEPMASRLRFYDDDTFAALARDAGFEHVEIAHRDLEAYARDEGVPDEHIPLFAGATSFLIATKG
jgi:SAM-dependent methyltransferase